MRDRCRRARRRAWVRVEAFLRLFPEWTGRFFPEKVPPEVTRGGATIRSMAEGAALTYADLAAFPDDGVRREIIDGELNPDADRVEVYLLRGDTYPKPAILEPGEMLIYDRLPGLAIDLVRVFAR